MKLIDLILVPIYLSIFYAVAFLLRNKFTSKYTRKYFIPALTVKFIGALSLGLIYYFYYSGGDTTLYFKDSQVLYNAFYSNFEASIKLFLATSKPVPEIFNYTSQIYFYDSYSEYIIVKITAFFSLLGFGSYSVAALFYAFVSFTGVWALYITFLKLFPNLHKEFAISILFLPSVFFWGSGVLKDSITLGCLGWLFYGFYSAAMEKKNIIRAVVIALIAANYIYIIKVYILLAFLPPALLWVFNENNARIKNNHIRILAKPIFLILGGGLAYFAATNLTAGNAMYDVTKIAERTEINNIYLSQTIASGSAYSIDTFDGSISSILKVAPTAITVSLFRPFLWEVRSAIMLLSAFESLLLLLLTLKIFLRVGILNTFKLIVSEPIVLFCMIFSMIFAFAVGTNSGNFGTLVRYKITLMPFYLSGLFIMQSLVTKAKAKTKKSTIKHHMPV